MRTPTKRFSLEGGPASLDCDGRLRECAMRCERGGMPNRGHVSVHPYTAGWEYGAVGQNDSREVEIGRMTANSRNATLCAC